jgi:beta-galactosidase
LIFDWNNRWAIDGAQGPRRDKRHDEIVLEHYTALRRLGINTDVIDMEQDFTPYRMIVAPMLYMIKPGVAQRLETFVQGGGQLAVTYLSGEVDQDDLCFRTGFPGPLRGLLGVWAEEIDALYPAQSNALRMLDGAAFTGTYGCDFLCELAHTETARAQAVYASDFYAGYPALTVNDVGKGQAWYIAAHTGEAFLVALYSKLARRAGVPRLLGDTPLPRGLHAASRTGADGTSYLFVMNFAQEPLRAALPAGLDLLTGEACGAGEAEIPPLGVRVLRV